VLVPQPWCSCLLVVTNNTVNMMEPTVTCPSPLTFCRRSAAGLAKEKVAKRVGVAILKIGSNGMQTTTGCEVTLLLQLQRTKDGVLSPQWARE